MISPLPAKAVAINPDGTLSTAFIEFLSEAFLGIAALQSSGITANRPTKYLFIGRTFFDTTLNKPIWISNDGLTWVDATGAPV